jgi:integrase
MAELSKAPLAHETAVMPSYSKALAEFHTTHVTGLRPRSAYQLSRNLTRHFQWTKPIDQITHHGVLTALEAIEARSQRAHALKDIRTFFNWCIPRYLKSSPCVGIKKPTQKPRDRVLADEELRKVWNRAREIDYPYGTIVQLLILTGQRLSEIAGLRWEWIGDGAITFPSEITKNARMSKIPLGATACRVIEETPRLSSLLFPRGVTPLDPSMASARARNRSTNAGLRTSCTTTCAVRSRRGWRASACVLKSPKHCSTTLAAVWVGSLASISVTISWTRCERLSPVTRRGSHMSLKRLCEIPWLYAGRPDFS